MSNSVEKRDMNVILGIFYSLRPKQWTKNLLVFAGILFSKNLFDYSLLITAILGFCILSLVSGSVYLINDINDLEEDKKHPRKCYRPLPSGQISVKQAIIGLLLIFSFSITTSFFINTYFGIVTIIYFLIVNLYTFYLKKIVILDVLSISIGFVLRAIAGVVIVETYISPWLIICTVLLALFLALSKRRHELSILKEEARLHRKVLQEYTIPYLDQMITIVTAGTIVSYSLYTFNSESIYLMATIPFVLYGIFRYLYLIHKHNMGGSPEIIFLEDKPLLINIGLWGIVCAFILYFT